jgi:hydroxymethylglutaryl-CoA lyase
MALPTSVKLVEVGPRDGLQNEAFVIPSNIKVNFINKLSETGLKMIEVTSFVSPKKIPQLADNAEVFTKINKKEGVRYSALVPNKIGLEHAIAAGVKDIAIFCSSTEAFSHRNINCSIRESFVRFREVMELAQQHSIAVRGYLSCVLGCPYEGDVNPERVARLAKELIDMGCYEVSLGDTIGVGTPFQASSLIDLVAQKIPIENIAVHFHDTYGQAIANLFAVLQLGVSVIDSSVAGLGGCPFAKNASGNVATEDVAYLLRGLKIETGVNLVALSKIGIFISNHLNRFTQSKVAQAIASNNFEIFNE